MLKTRSDFPDNPREPAQKQSETSEDSESCKFRKHGPPYPDIFGENGEVKVLSGSEKTALLKGKWEPSDLFAYSFPYRFERI